MELTRAGNVRILPPTVYCLVMITLAAFVLTTVSRSSPHTLQVSELVLRQCINQHERLLCFVLQNLKGEQGIIWSLSFKKGANAYGVVQSAAKFSIIRQTVKGLDLGACSVLFNSESSLMKKKASWHSQIVILKFSLL